MGKNASFFMDYEFKAHAMGFFGTMSGFKVYSIGYYEEVEKLINDCMKILKCGNDACVTFQAFDITPTDLCRIYTDCLGNGKAHYVKWKRNRYGYVSETEEKEIALNKREVKKCVLEAIELFRDYDNDSAATD